METIINTLSSSGQHQLSRNIIFSILSSLKHSSLTINDSHGTFSFGESDSKLQAEIQVHDTHMYQKLLFGGSIGIAESYVEGEWDSEQLVEVMRIFARNLPTLDKLEKKMGWLTLPFQKLLRFKNRNTRSGSRTNIAAHYDLGNDMYELILDHHMQYSSAIFPDMDDSLEYAQKHKLKTICDSLELKADDHLLEIGTGWGGLACYAAQHYGCRITTTTLSRQQYNFAQKRIQQLGLQDRITLLLSDYRELQGQYSKLVSVEMIEAVGHEFMPQYFKQLEKLIKPQGQMLIQAITIADQNYDQYRKNVDFIQKYIFPGGCLPSISEMTRHLKNHTHMVATSIQDYGEHYAQTLAHWDERFTKQPSQLSKMGYDKDFQRLWHFYFAYCEGGFREGNIGLVHFQAKKTGV